MAARCARAPAFRCSISRRPVRWCVIPTASVNEPFMFAEVTADYQDVTIQGQVTYRIADPRRTAALLNFALDAERRYVVR